MAMLMSVALLVVAAVVVPMPAAAQPPPATTAQQTEALLARCNRCHSFDRVAARHVAAREPHQALFEAKCKQCHTLGLVAEAHRSGKAVGPVVERMREKPGSNLSDADVRELEMWTERIKALP